jgi:hypothetical protein
MIAKTATQPTEGNSGPSQRSVSIRKNNSTGGEACKEKISAELRERDQWVAWKSVPRLDDKKPIKMPIDVRIERGAQANNPRTCANEDSLGCGIPGIFKVGRHAVYPLRRVLAKLRSKISAAAAVGLMKRNVRRISLCLALAIIESVALRLPYSDKLSRLLDRLVVASEASNG